MKLFGKTALIQITILAQRGTVQLRPGTGIDPQWSHTLAQPAL